jgi:phosphoribosylanthranilate isomerase
VAVFVEENAADITRACAAADVSIAQLHGDGARGALADLPPDLKVVYVLHAEADGTIRTPLPQTVGGLVRTSELRKGPGGRGKEQQRAEKRKRKKERREKKLTKIQEKEERRPNELAQLQSKEERRGNKVAQQRDQRRAEKAERTKETAKRKDEVRECMEFLRKREELYEKQEKLAKEFEAKTTEIEALLRFAELIEPLYGSDPSVEDLLAKLWSGLGALNGGISVHPSRLCLDATRKNLEKRRESVASSREALCQFMRFLEGLRTRFEIKKALDERMDQSEREAEESAEQLDEAERELDRAARGLYESKMRYYEVKRQWYRDETKKIGYESAINRDRRKEERAINRDRRKNERKINRNRRKNEREINRNRRKDEREINRDRRKRELDELERRLHLECTQASGNETTPQTEGEGAQNTSIEAEKFISEAGSSAEPGVVEWLLVDKVLAGSGEAPYDWTNLQVPHGLSRRGWLLAGGLDPTNVAAALGAAAPDGVDVSSGVMGLDNMTMDKTKVAAFIQAV